MEILLLLLETNNILAYISNRLIAIVNSIRMSYHYKEEYCTRIKTPKEDTVQRIS